MVTSAEPSAKVQLSFEPADLVNRSSLPVPFPFRWPLLFTAGDELREVGACRSWLRLACDGDFGRLLRPSVGGVLGDFPCVGPFGLIVAALVAAFDRVGLHLIDQRNHWVVSLAEELSREL